MPIELEQVREGLYFKYRGTVIRIQEVHFPFLPAMRHELEPIPLVNTELFMLNFSMIRDKNYGEYEKYAEGGQHFWLKKSAHKGWIIGIGKADTGAEVNYVHQLQDIWMALFQEVLRRRGDEPAPPVKMTYRLIPDRIVTVPAGLDTFSGRYSGTVKQYSERIPYQEQLYYLSWDCCYLFRNIRYAIWRVTRPTEKRDILFEFAGRTWGLVLVAGKETTDADTRAAGRWVHTHLAENLVQQG